ncbi:hypothetical protein D3C74_505510 [compost metagenome]
MAHLIFKNSGDAQDRTQTLQFCASANARQQNFRIPAAQLLTELFLEFYEFLHGSTGPLQRSP